MYVLYDGYSIIIQKHTKHNIWYIEYKQIYSTSSTTFCVMFNHVSVNILSYTENFTKTFSIINKHST